MCAQRAKTAEKDLYLNFEKFQKKSWSQILIRIIAQILITQY